jgi:hypothetical protein
VTAHAPLPPSSAKRWMECPGSVRAERESPPLPASDFSEAGTAAHKLFARCLLHGLRPQALTANPDLLLPLILALDLTRKILAGRPSMVELRLPQLYDLPKVWGTTDLIVFSDEGPIEAIIDLKFGEAIGVEANTVQLGIYGLLAARQFGVAPTGLTTWIIQPRHDHDGGPARYHHYSPADLERLESRLRQAVVAIEQPAAPRRAGEWCRFCAAVSCCPARQRAPNAVPAAQSAWFRQTPRWLAAPNAAQVSP